MGKSTIARTVTRRLDDSGKLGGSFFFKRGEGDRGKAVRFFPTIAIQLVNKRPGLAQHIRSAIERDKLITDKAMSEQFEKLILGPLGAVETKPGILQTIVVVVDALDECDGIGDTQTIIRLLLQAKHLKSQRLKFFLTSRPEDPILSQFRKSRGSLEDLILQDVPERVVRGDIRHFLDSELREIRERYNQEAHRLSPDWPGTVRLEKLVERAIPLFIVAATFCRFIRDKRHVQGGPDGRLSKIIENQAKGQRSSLDDMYHLVLAASVKEEAMDDFRQVIGSIVILARPLSGAALAMILRIQKINIDEMLDLLRSVLDVPSEHDAPIRLLHLSFRDFLVDHNNRQTHRFWIDEEETHKLLTTRCLDLLMKDGSLKKDICGLRILGTLGTDIDRRKIDACLPSEIQYACLYWVYNLLGVSPEGKQSRPARRAPRTPIPSGPFSRLAGSVEPHREDAGEPQANR